MKQFVKTAALFSLLAFLFSSCKDCETTVTEIELEEAQWLVYERGDTARFLNELGEEVNYVHATLRTDPVPGTGTSINDDCISHYDRQAFSIMENRNGENPALVTFLLKRRESFKVNLALMYFGGQSVAEYNLDITDTPAEFVEINGKRYFDVYEVVMPEETKPTYPKRILFNKTEGFLSVDFVNGKKLEITT